jgi:hypothetical protein
MQGFPANLNLVLFPSYNHKNVRHPLLERATQISHPIPTKEGSQINAPDAQKKIPTFYFDTE